MSSQLIKRFEWNFERISLQVPGIEPGTTGWEASHLPSILWLLADDTSVKSTPKMQQNILFNCKATSATFLIGLTSISGFSRPFRGWQPRKLDLFDPYGVSKVKLPGCQPLKGLENPEISVDNQKSLAVWPCSLTKYHFLYDFKSIKSDKNTA